MDFFDNLAGVFQNYTDGQAYLSLALSAADLAVHGDVKPNGRLYKSDLSKDHIVEETVKTGKRGRPKVIKKLQSNVKYKTGEFDYSYETDNLGRIRNASTKNLQLTNRKVRLSHDPKSFGKIEGDQSGHLFGDRFGGSPDIDNLVSQKGRELNQGKYKKLENKWAKATEEGKQVNVDIKINYENDNIRPSSFDVNYSIDGDAFKQNFEN